MYMHVTAGEGMHKNGLILKVTFVAQYRREAGLREALA